MRHEKLVVGNLYTNPKGDSRVIMSLSNQRVSWASRNAGLSRGACDRSAFLAWLGKAPTKGKREEGEVVKGDKKGVALQTDSVEDLPEVKIIVDVIDISNTVTDSLEPGQRYINAIGQPRVIVAIEDGMVYWQGWGKNGKRRHGRCGIAIFKEWLLSTQPRSNKRKMSGEDEVEHRQLSVDEERLYFAKPVCDMTLQEVRKTHAYLNLKIGHVPIDQARLIRRRLLALAERMPEFEFVPRTVGVVERVTAQHPLCSVPTGH